MTRENVYTIQGMLNKMGYLVPMSGQIDAHTYNAVTEIQRRLHITPDGELNPNTVQAIIEASNPVRMARPQVVAGAYSAGDAPTHTLPRPKGV